MVFDPVKMDSDSGMTAAEAIARVRELEAQLAECMSAEMARQQMFTLLAQMRQESDLRAQRISSLHAKRHQSGADLFNESSDLTRQQASLVAEGLWDVSAYASATNSPRFSHDSAALLRRVTDLERENATIDKKRVEAEADAQTQRANYLDLLTHMNATEHVDFLSMAAAPPRVPAAFRHLSPSELLPSIIDAYESQTAARVVLETTVANLRTELAETKQAFAALTQEVLLKDEVATSQEGELEALHVRIDNLSATQERVMQDNAMLQAALAANVRQLDRATHLLKEKDKERSDALAESDVIRIALAESQREVEAQRENIRLLDAEREVFSRKLDGANKKLAESEKRWAELAQSSLQEGLDEKSAQKVQRQWLEMFRALGGRKASFATPAPQSRSTPIPVAASAAGPVPHHRAASMLSGSMSTTSLLVPPTPTPHLTADHTVASTSPVQSHQHLQSASQSTVALGHAALPPAHTSSSEAPPQQRSTPVNLSPDMGGSASQEHFFPPGAHPAAVPPLSQPTSKQPSPDPPAERHARTAVPLPPGRLLKGAAPGRPAQPSTATLAAIAHIPRPKVRMNDKSVLEQALMSRAERAKQAVVDRAAARKRGAPPPPTSLKDIHL